MLRGDQQPPNSDVPDFKVVSQREYDIQHIEEFYPLSDWRIKKINFVTIIPKQSLKLNHLTTDNQFSYVHLHQGGSIYSEL